MATAARRIYELRVTLLRRVGQARKRDANEKAIVVALKQAGIRVWRLSEPGFPDLAAWLPRTPDRLVLLEVKAAKGKLTNEQKSFDGPRHIVRTPAEALAVFGIELR